MATVTDHERWMSHAITLAKRGTGFVSPNPRVGCVIVHNNKILSEGWHKAYGELHAEADAIQQLESPLPADAILYVNLEPCAHFGKRPPCADAIIAAGLNAVVIGCGDPYQEVAGRGIARLKDAGINVIVGVCEQESLDVNKWFIHNVTTGLPYVILKLAQSIDGGIAPIPKRRLQLSGDESNEVVHQLRSRVDAVMVGSKTVGIDNPKLTSRVDKGRDPKRIVVDPDDEVALDSFFAVNATPENSFVLTNDTYGAAPMSTNATVISATTTTGLDLEACLRQLYEHNIGSILCEGGAGLASSLIELNLVDELRIIVAPTILGSALRLQTPLNTSFSLVSAVTVGPDVHLTYHRKKP